LVPNDNGDAARRAAEATEGIDEGAPSETLRSEPSGQEVDDGQQPFARLMGRLDLRPDALLPGVAPYSEDAFDEDVHGRKEAIKTLQGTPAVLIGFGASRGFWFRACRIAALTTDVVPLCVPDRAVSSLWATFYATCCGAWTVVKELVPGCLPWPGVCQVESNLQGVILAGTWMSLWELVAVLASANRSGINDCRTQVSLWMRNDARTVTTATGKGPNAF
jgi:hypothetical protein